ncbi:hypothetical protein QQS21_006970 [Conoideocrella luteorostrata]|uniref:MOSC domain-containing protein n=1 Tax=Conoideocrella luteorostrata TaxID=1105319 RepID=A0AAJ0CLS1_9HYPO|nr:hypothetical protein QQS21_006970 [Conoideocrella luteorostrata]
MRVDDTDPSKLTKVQIDKNHECGLFKQDIVGDKIYVSYLTPKKPILPALPHQNVVLEVPLHPDKSDLETVDIDLHLSMVKAYRMDARYNDWFSACFGFKAILVYIGDGRRPVLGTYAPRLDGPPRQQGWLSTLSGYATGNSQRSKDPPWITFSDLAPFLVVSEKSLANIQARLPSSDIEITAFRPNIVIDGESEFDEDFWAELSTNNTPFLTLTKMCNRCTSLNVDYDTGKIADGERGTVLKKLMSDRRVDKGAKYSPVFGKYGFLIDEQENMTLLVGDDITVTKRADERPIFDWPLRSKNAQPQFYHME